MQITVWAELHDVVIINFAIKRCHSWMCVCVCSLWAIYDRKPIESWRTVSVGDAEE